MHESCPIFNNSRPSDRDGRHNGLRAHTSKARRPVCLALWRPHSSGTLHISKETYICEKRWMKETNICEKSPMKKTYIFEKSPMKETAKACCPIRLSIWRSHRITYIRYVKRDLNMWKLTFTCDLLYMGPIHVRQPYERGTYSSHGIKYIRYVKRDLNMWKLTYISDLLYVGPIYVREPYEREF